MITVTPNLAQHSAATVQAAETSYALNTLAELFDWSKGAAQKNSARITSTNLPRIEPKMQCQEPGSVTISFAPAKVTANAQADVSTDIPVDIFTRVNRLLDAAMECPKRVPAILAGQARQLNARQFAKLMSAVEETGSNWTESEKYFVFTYPSGTVGSVWLGGCEVYNSIWKNY